MNIVRKEIKNILSITFITNMSSNRANAAARQRRAGEPVGLQQQQQQQQRMQPGRGSGVGGRPSMPDQQQQQQPIMNPKLSISDAIALITLRLGRVEMIVSNLPNEPRGDRESGGQMYDENMRMVDQNVFNSIVSRIDTLEKNQKLLIEKQKTGAVTPVVQNVAAPIQQLVQETIIKDISDEKIEPMRESIEVLKDELVELKDLLMKLQSFTMETNKKLTDIVFDDNIPQMFNNSFMFHGGASMMGGQQFGEDIGDEMIVLENIDEEESDEIACENLQSINLKELIKQELMNEDEQGIDNM
jgi:hypothetical protein